MEKKIKTGMILMAAFTLLSVVSGCGSKENGILPQTTGKKRISIHVESIGNFNGNFQGPMTATSQGRSQGMGDAMISIQQSPGQLDHITLQIPVQPGTYQTLEFPMHRIQGNDLMDTTTDLAKVGEIGSNSFFFKRPSIGTMSFKMRSDRQAFLQIMIGEGASMMVMEAEMERR